MKECGFPTPPLAPYKGAGWGLSRPAQPIKTKEEQATKDRPAASTHDGPVSCLHRRDPKCMETTWRARRAEATGEATSPHPVIVGSGRPGNRALAPFVHRTAPPRLPPLMEKAQTVPFITT